MNLATRVYESPVGPLYLAVSSQGELVRISFLSETTELKLVEELTNHGFQLGGHPSVLAEVEAQLNAYFNREITDFSLALAPIGTPFQQAVWAQLCKIPYGTCCTYGDIAHALHNPGASRAVGLANNRNPIPIVIPCHRVIGGGVKLTGFGGGLPTKHALLVHEGYYLI